MQEFVGDEIEVCCAERPLTPSSFTWRGVEYQVAEIKKKWRTLDLGKTWWRRRHRDYYIVETTAGEMFQLYHHRGPGRKYWVLLKRLRKPSGPT